MERKDCVEDRSDSRDKITCKKEKESGTHGCKLGLP